MISKMRMLLAMLCVIVLTLCFIFISQLLLGRAKLDLTEHKIYTLSGETRNILDQLNQPVSLDFYYSRTAAMKGPEQIRFFNTYYHYVRDLLEEYTQLADGRIALNIIDPRPFTEEEEEAVQFGVRRFPLSDDESFFFGLVARTERGEHKTIEFFEPDRQEFVEYDVSKLITDVTRREKRKVGVMSSLPVTAEDLSPYMRQMMQMQGRRPPEPWNLITHLEEQFEIEKVPENTEALPADIDFLMLIHPKHLDENTLFAVDQYVMRGGRLLVFVDPQCFSDEPEEDPSDPYAAMEHSAASDLNALLRGWGVEMLPDQIAADRSLATRVRVREHVEHLPVYLRLNEDCVNKEEVITANLHTIHMLYPGVLRKVPGVGADLTPLLTTTAEAAVWEPRSPFELQMGDPAAINRAAHATGEPLMLACMITGNLKTNFPDGRPVPEQQDGEDDDGEGADDGEQRDDLPPLLEESEDAMVMVFADVDMIADTLAYERTAFGASQRGDNASIVFNALEYLAGTGDLIAIRSRGRFERPFLRVDEIETEAEKATAEETEALNRRISEHEQRLRELSSTATDSEDDVELLRSTALSEREKIQNEIWKARRQLRALQAGKRAEIEALKGSLQTHNMVWSPAAVLLIAIILAAVNILRKKYYHKRRM